MPTNMQIITETYDDVTALQIAAAHASAAPTLFTGGTFPDFRSDDQAP